MAGRTESLRNDADLAANIGIVVCGKARTLIFAVNWFRQVNDRIVNWYGVCARLDSAHRRLFSGDNFRSSKLSMRFSTPS